MSSFGMIKEGWLTKCGGGHKSWKRRWFILQENLLYYFADKKDMESKGTILLSKVMKVQVASAAAAQKRKFVFEVITSERSYPIQADSEAEMKEWMDAINTINTLHSLRDTYKGREHNMTDNYRGMVVASAKKILQYVAKITGITKGLGGKHKWAKQETDPKKIEDENRAVCNAAITFSNDALNVEKEPMKEGARRQFISSGSYLRDLCSKMTVYAEGGPNDAALKAQVAQLGKEVKMLDEAPSPTPKKEILWLVRSMGEVINKYVEAKNADERAVAAKKLEAMANEVPSVAHSVFQHITDVQWANPFMERANKVPQVTRDVRELVKNAAFFTDATRNANNATDTLYFLLNDLRRQVMGAFPREPGDNQFKQIGPANTQFPEDSEPEPVASPSISTGVAYASLQHSETHNQGYSGQAAYQQQVPQQFGMDPAVEQQIQQLMMSQDPNDQYQAQYLLQQQQELLQQQMLQMQQQQLAMMQQQYGQSDQMWSQQQQTGYGSNPQSVPAAQTMQPQAGLYGSPAHSSPALARVGSRPLGSGGQSSPNLRGSGSMRQLSSSPAADANVLAALDSLMAQQGGSPSAVSNTTYQYQQPTPVMSQPQTVEGQQVLDELDALLAQTGRPM
eukprot:TRINITY_DN3871_c0_g1_i1.p1 TRINITY_DN3871_c0_g1~~TRINITY_DN3871_c0_g1_i1.p1  ORF type:complete len:622 (+),score=140.15 TRINITY_DN3871_c0_g1_i1:65-1930(+)